MSSYSDLNSHRGMVFDDARNRAYAEALEAVINPNSVVLDLGAGLGILGLMAAAKGARHVYLVDPSPVITIAGKVAADNGLASRVTCIQKSIEQTDLPEPVDLITSVFTGNFLLGEDLLPILFHARDRFLKPSGRLLPDRGEMWLVPVAAEQYHTKYVSRWSTGPQGIDFSQVRKYAANSLYLEENTSAQATFLAEPEIITNLDFAVATRANCSSDTTFVMNHAGDCHGFLGWFRMRLGDKWLSTSPVEPALHWSQVFLPLDPAIQVTVGDPLSIRLARPQFGDWSWISRHAGSKQKHSTFYSHALSLEQLRCHSKEHQVALNENGELVRFVLDQMTGRKSIRAIFELVSKRFEDRYSSHEELEKQVQSVISSYGK